MEKQSRVNVAAIMNEIIATLSNAVGVKKLSELEPRFAKLEGSLAETMKTPSATQPKVNSTEIRLSLLSFRVSRGEPFDQPFYDSVPFLLNALMTAAKLEVYGDATISNDEWARNKLLHTSLLNAFAQLGDELLESAEHAELNRIAHEIDPNTSERCGFQIRFDIDMLARLLEATPENRRMERLAILTEELGGLPKELIGYAIIALVRLSSKGPTLLSTQRYRELAKRIAEIYAA